MERRRCVLLVLLAMCGTAWAQEWTPPEGSLGARLATVRAIAENDGLSEAEKLAALTDLLERELADPCGDAPSYGVTATEAVQSACMHLLAESVSAAAIVNAVRQGGGEGRVRDLLTLSATLAACREGDAAAPETRDWAKEACLGLLASHADDFIRSKAALALGDLGIRDGVVPALADALSDPSYRSQGNRVGALGGDRVYLVRREAACALMRLGYETARSDYTTWVLEPDLTLGVDVAGICAEHGVEAERAGVVRSGVVHRLKEEPTAAVAVGVFPSIDAAQSTWSEILRFTPLVPEWPGPDGIPGGVRWAGGAVGFCELNVVCWVLHGEPERGLEIAQGLYAGVHQGGPNAPKGRPVVMPEITLTYPETVRERDQYAVHAAVAGGEAALWGLGSSEPWSEMDIPYLLACPTEPGLCVRTFDFATPECVMVRKTVIIKVVPWEDEGPAAGEE